jgi:nucleoside-diphosphate-sugar epimerase
VEIFSGNLTSKDAVSEAYNGFDTIVSCVGRPIIHHQVQLIELADKHPDVKKFFPSEYGTDVEYGPASKDEKPHQQKLKVRAALSKVRNLEYTYVVTGPYADADPGLFLAARGDDEGGSFDVAEKRAVLLGDGKGEISLTTMHDVGRFVVAALIHPDAVKNKAIRVNSFTAIPNDIVAEFEKQTGGHPWQVSYTPLAKLKQMEERAWAKNDPQAGTLTLRRIWTEGGTLYEKRENDLVGLEQTESLADAVKRAIDVQNTLR